MSSVAVLAGARQARARLDVIPTLGLAAQYDLTRVNLFGASELQGEVAATGSGVSTRTPETKTVPGIGAVGGMAIYQPPSTADYVNFAAAPRFFTPEAGKQYTISWYYTATKANCAKASISCRVGGTAYWLSASNTWDTAFYDSPLPNAVSATPLRISVTLPPLPAGAVSGVLRLEIPFRAVGDFNYWWGGIQANVGATALPYEKTLDAQTVAESGVNGLNLIPSSEDFSVSSWGKNVSGTGVAAVITNNAELAPDGTMTAARFVFDLGAGTTSGDFTQVLVTGPVTVSGDSGCSAWLRTTDGSTKVMSMVAPSGKITSITVTPTWQVLSSLGPVAAPSNFAFRLRLRGNESTASQASVAIWHPMGHVGATPLPYERSAVHGVLGATAAVEATDPVPTPAGLVFDGVDDRVAMPPLPYTGFMTMSAVFTPAGVGNTGFHGLLSGVNGANYYPRMLISGYTELVMQWGFQASHNVPVTRLVHGTPAHYLATWDGQTSRVYLNGRLLASAALSITIPSGAGAFWLGVGAAAANVYTANGTISFAQVYNRALSDREVQQAYRALKKRLALRGVTLS